MNKEEEKLYLRGYKDGMYAGLKMCWALAEELLISVDNSAKTLVAEFIEKIKK